MQWAMVQCLRTTTLEHFCLKLYNPAESPLNLATVQVMAQ